MTHRLRWLTLGTAVAALAAAGFEFRSTGSVPEAAEAALAAVIAGAVVALAIDIGLGHPDGRRWAGLAVGGLFVAAGMTSWTISGDTLGGKLVVWGLLAAGGIAFMALSRPWPAQGRSAVRLGGAWLGLSYWVIAVLGSALLLKTGITAQRVAYLAVFLFAVLFVVKRTRGDGDLSAAVGVVFLLAIGALVLMGSGTLFDSAHVVPATGWGSHMEDRFWGGPALLYHPNSMAGLAVAVAVRFGVDDRCSPVQRVGVLLVATGVLVFTGSRTGFVFALTAAVAFAVLVRLAPRRERFAGLVRDRRRWVVGLLPFVALSVVLLAPGHYGVQFTERYEGVGVTTGRVDTWKKVLTDWRGAPVVEKLFGDTSDARATVSRPDSPGVKLTTDNAVVGALRRGGVLGVVAFLAGIALLLRRIVVLPLRNRTPLPPAWTVVFLAAVGPTVATADWLLGGTGGTIWVLLLAGEAAVLFPRVAGRDPVAAGGPAEGPA